MDRSISPKPFWFRYRYYLIGALLFLSLIVYILIVSTGGQKLRIDLENIVVAEARQDKFLEYLNVEGIVQPILTVKINTLESGRVDRIVAEGGMMVDEGDTILVLSNPELLRTIEDQRDEWERQRITFRQQEIEMEQKSINLRQQTLQNTYELNRLAKSFALDQEEFEMGVISKAQLEVKRDEFEYRKKSTALQLEGLRGDSISSRLRQELMKNEVEQAGKKFLRVQQRADHLVVRAPVSGQLSSVEATPGQQVGGSTTIGEIKILEPFKLYTQLDEYYIDRIVSGLPAYAIVGAERYPLRITKVVPEVRDRSFEVDLVFSGERPENIRIGKAFRVQIELDQAEEAVIIPRGDFFPVTGGQWIFRINEAGTKAVRVPIAIGRQNPQHYEVISGLANGDRVILSGYNTFGEAAELLLKQ
ncbi:MAG: HlyD family efflux transporter periplasmic adaptor subunit [Culturomica sp.]|jgi:multidrug efflux pump subunit AcrA (membrane-fusion protein)|nr:HlyD family efflux transporter periplasmic adaptor subunit [Culturomica sp.]